jgi:hypothetical protein
MPGSMAASVALVEDQVKTLHSPARMTGGLAVRVTAGAGGAAARGASGALGQRAPAWLAASFARAMASVIRPAQ